MILLYFSETERNSAELDIIDRRSQIINSVRSYNRRFSGKKKDFFSFDNIHIDEWWLSVFQSFSSPWTHRTYVRQFSFL